MYNTTFDGQNPTVNHVPPYDLTIPREAAFWYIREMGWLALPAVGKIPLCHWNYDELPALIAREAIARFEHPYTNVVLVTGGRSQLVVGDCDPQHGGDPEEFFRRGWPRETVLARSGRGGLHIYWRCGSDGLPSVWDYGQGLEVKANGAIIVAPPSRHPDTFRCYAWIAGHEPWAVPLALVPDPVAADILNHHPRPQHPRQRLEADPAALRPLAYPPEETIRLVTNLLNWAIDRTLLEHRNNVAYQLGLQLGSLGLSKREVAAVAALYERAVRYGE